MKAFKILLGEWLCSYYEVKFIDIASQAAESKGGVLIYRDIDGQFSLTPPIDSINRNNKKMIDEVRSPIKDKQKQRKSLASVRNKELITPIYDLNALNKILSPAAFSCDCLFCNCPNTEPSPICILENHKISMELSLLNNAIRENGIWH